MKIGEYFYYTYDFSLVDHFFPKRKHLIFFRTKFILTYVVRGGVGVGVRVCRVVRVVRV